jgi:hypothetical protein
MKQPIKTRVVAYRLDTVADGKQAEVVDIHPLLDRFNYRRFGWQFGNQHSHPGVDHEHEGGVTAHQHQPPSPAEHAARTGDSKAARVLSWLERIFTIER